MTPEATSDLVGRIRSLSEARGPRAYSLDHLVDLVDRLGLTRVLLVIDRGAADATRATSRIRAQLGEKLVGEFDAFQPNPTSEQAAAAARAALEARADGFVAFGGGSCMDVAKVASLGASHAERLVELCEGAEPAGVEPLPVVAVPTTSGTGSETTHFSAIYVRGRKVSVTHQSMRPRAVIMDIGLHSAMPPRLAASVGLDALCQAVESTWAVGSTPESIEYSRLGGALVGASLAESVLTGGVRAREAMMWGSHAAGMAIDISKTTAPHALSYQFTTRYGIPHGIAAALTLGHIGRANGEVTDQNCRDPRGSEWVRSRVADAAVAIGATSRSFPSAVRELLRRLGLPATLQEAGVERAALADMAAEVDPVRLSNNPRALTVAELVAVLDEAWPT